LEYLVISLVVKGVTLKENPQTYQPPPLAPFFSFNTQPQKSIADFGKTPI